MALNALVDLFGILPQSEESVILKGLISHDNRLQCDTERVNLT